MKSGTCLVICREPRDLSMLDEFRGSEGKVIVATDDIQIQKTAKRNRHVKEVIFLDQMISFFAVREDALNIYYEINNWLLQQAPEVRSFLIEWAKHAEGGMTTQRIFDVLICLRSYLKIIEENNVKTIILRRHKGTIFEDDILVEAARSRSVEVREHWSAAVMVCRYFNLRVIPVRLLGKERALYIPAALLNFILSWKIMIDILRERLLHGITSGKINQEKRLVIYLLGSSADKHIDNISANMEEFDQREGFGALALCWGAADGKRKIEARGLCAENLEAWISLGQCMRTFRKYRKIRRGIYDNMRYFLRDVDLRYQGVALGRFFLPSFRYFARVDLLNRLLMYSALNGFFSEHRPAAMKTFGGVRLDLGRIASETARERIGPSALIFQYWLGVNMNVNFGMPPSDAIDLFFVHGELDRDHVRKMLPRAEVVVGGYPRQNYIHEIRKMSPAESLNIVGVRKDTEYIIFYASAGVIIGYAPRAEAVRVADCMMKLAGMEDKVTILIKPHPAESAKYIHDLYNNNGRPGRVRILDKTAPIYHCINASDIVVTTFSTVALEAMMLDKPVVSLLVSGESRFQDAFGNGVEKFQAEDPFISFIRDKLSSRQEFETWQNERLRMQEIWLPQKIWQPSIPVEKVIVDHIAERLAKQTGKGKPAEKQAAGVS